MLPPRFHLPHPHHLRVLERLLTPPLIPKKLFEMEGNLLDSSAESGPKGVTARSGEKGVSTFLSNDNTYGIA